MKEVKICELYEYVKRVMTAYGMTEENAETTADVFLRATLRGVGHHDIYDFASRVKRLQDGKAVPNPVYRKLSAFGGMESYDAGNGLGEVVCSFAMERAISLADEHGVGLVALRNTNHFLAAAPYVEAAAEKGYVGLLLCKGAPSMGAPGKAGVCMSALPMGFAYPTDEDFPVMLDICLAYASYGQLIQKASRGESIPHWWGFDENGEPSTDPGAVAKGTRAPVGGHKGFGLAMLGETLTGVLSNGCVLDEKETSDGVKNHSSHTAIAIKADALTPLSEFKTRAGDLNRRARALSPGVHLPGEGSRDAKRRFEEGGVIPLEESLFAELNVLAETLSVKPLG